MDFIMNKAITYKKHACEEIKIVAMDGGNSMKAKYIKNRSSSKIKWVQIQVYGYR